MPIKSKEPAPISSKQTVSEAFATILKHNLDYLILWEKTARSPKDIEGVHQIRVSFRRMRSALSLFQKVIPKSVTSLWNEEMRGLAGQLGLARDLDVFIDEGLCSLANKLPLPGEGKLLDIASDHRAKVYKEEVCAMLDSERYSMFKTEFRYWFENRLWEKELQEKKQQKKLSMNLVDFSRKLMDRQERRVLSAGSNIDKTSPKEMHKLRIECKKLRYAAEFFIPIFTGMDVFIKHMKGLQDLLGLMNDIAVMQHLLD
ncbi:MAG: CHAD domain-containing protein, partial [Gammaproteobacteria bacterium]